MTEVQQGIIALLKSAVTGHSCPLPGSFTLENADAIIRKQGLISLAFQGVHLCGLPGKDRYHKEYIMNLIRSEQQLRDAERIFQIFEENQIEYLPVKGCEMKKLYPMPELRVMGDADILIHPEQHEKIKSLLQNAGFVFSDENAHVYEWKSDRLYVELHKSLVPPSDEDYYAYYGTGWRLAKQCGGYRHTLTNEDAFLFLFTHFARHYRFSGIGCRHVVDLYVYRRAFPDLNQHYLNRELQKLRLLEFYDNTMRLLDVWFENREPDAVTELMTAFIFSDGSWGNETSRRFHEAVKSKQLQRRERNYSIRAAIRAVFPPSAKIQYTYPTLKKHPWLLPLFWVIRWFDILLIRNYVIRRKLEAHRTAGDIRVDDYEEALRTVGLDFGVEKSASRQ